MNDAFRQHLEAKPVRFQSRSCRVIDLLSIVSAVLRLQSTRFGCGDRVWRQGTCLACELQFLQRLRDAEDFVERCGKSLVSGVTEERQSSFIGVNRRPADGYEISRTRSHLAGDRDMQNKSVMQLRNPRSDRNHNRIIIERSSGETRLSRTCLKFAVLFAIFWFSPSHGAAVDFYGSDPLGSTGLTVGPDVDLLNTDQFNLSTVFGNPGTGDFGSVPHFMVLTPEDWLIDISDLSGLTLGTEEFGTFTAINGNVVSRSPEFVIVELNGLFERASFDDTAASMHFAMTKTGQSVSWSGTLAVGMNSGTGNVVPEPQASVFAVLGVLSLMFLARRRHS